MTLMDIIYIHRQTGKAVHVEFARQPTDFLYKVTYEWNIILLLLYLRKKDKKKKRKKRPTCDEKWRGAAFEFIIVACRLVHVIFSSSIFYIHVVRTADRMS